MTTRSLNELREEIKEGIVSLKELREEIKEETISLNELRDELKELTEEIREERSFKELKSLNEQISLKVQKSSNEEGCMIIEGYKELVKSLENQIRREHIEHKQDKQKTELTITTLRNELKTYEMEFYNNEEMETESCTSG